MNYIEETLRRQAAMFAALLGGGQRRKEDEEKRAGRNGETATESGGDGALRLPFFAENPEERQGSPREMTVWNRLLARRGEGRHHQATGTRELTVAEIPTAGSRGAESLLMESGRRETMRRNAGKNAARRKNGDGMGQGFGGAEMISPEGTFFGSREIHTGTAGAVSVVDGVVSAERTVLVVDGGMSAGELSRTFQRDARRYDGGYPLY